MSNIPDQTLDTPKSVLQQCLHQIIDFDKYEREQAECLNQTRMSFLGRGLLARIQIMTDAEQRQSCDAIVDQLDNTTLDELLRSPILCEMLRTAQEDDQVMFLLDRAFKQYKGEAIDAWSILGNHWLGNEDDICQLNRASDREYCPTLLPQTPVDNSLPDRIENPSMGVVLPARLTRAEQKAAAKVVDSSVLQLREIYPAGYQYFKQIISTLVFRKDLAREVECWGATSGKAVGRMVLVNCHTTQDNALLTESMLHETVRTALDCAEFYQPLWKYAENFNEHLKIKVTSPWSNNDIHWHAFVHAIVVWAVLYEYWLAYEKHEGQNKISAKRLAYISKGFQALIEDEQLMDMLQRNGPVIRNIAQICFSAVQVSNASVETMDKSAY